MYASLIFNYALYWLIYKKPYYFKETPQRNIINLCFISRIYQIVNILPNKPLTLNINVLFFLLGQLLNLSVYYKLGNKGVYYGKELGTVNLPMIKSFPYNIIPHHPQYIGTLMSLLSYMTMVDDVNYLNLWVSLVAITMYVEN